MSLNQKLKNKILAVSNTEKDFGSNEQIAWLFQTEKLFAYS